MTERTYGQCKGKLAQIEDFWSGNDVVMDMAAHIRELQAEVNIYKSCTTPTEINLAARILELESEVDKLKTERREFGVRIANAILAACQSKGYPGEMYKTHISTIVEQELNK